ncbi:unnamed protein product [Diplocarpon coronariae]|uniref:Large ribosomal subunit protein uL6m n=1 Tax=Diplocarpon coronariae TaxID=2795749 RepID=A0A218Z1T8_9HELO|nr:mitochondrial 54S ribosomal protein YmL16 [Diplocarpon mali]OWP02041.1 hypothetical protein B2J93_1513 [Marssonina coronariae]
MLSTARSKGLERAVFSATSVSIPAFLLPALPAVSSRSFSSTPNRPSQIGRAPLSIPPEVNFTILPPPIQKNDHGSPISARPTVHIEGPLGKMSMTIPAFVDLQHDTAIRKVFVTVQDREIQKQREMWGTTRAYLQNHILGVSEGHSAILRLVGVGYRATVENTATTVEPEFEGQQFVVLKVGYSHPIELPIPRGMKASTPQPTRILLEGCEKEVVLQFAANIRMWRKPEPYKGKGIFVNGESIKLKAKKIK